MNAEGRGPGWTNSLFEDNAEFGLGFRLTLDKQTEYARELLVRLADDIGPDLVQELLSADQSTEDGIYQQRRRVKALKRRLTENHTDSSGEAAPPRATRADAMHSGSAQSGRRAGQRSVWIVGGDGWAYDIGKGGLDHVLASGHNVNIPVLDTEVYSNTGGRTSKSTPRAAVAKFAAGGKQTAKKDLGLLAMAYSNVYVARVAMGASDVQTLRAFWVGKHVQRRQRLRPNRKVRRKLPRVTDHAQQGRFARKFRPPVNSPGLRVRDGERLATVDS